MAQRDANAAHAPGVTKAEGAVEAPIEGEVTAEELKSMRNLAGLESFSPVDGLAPNELCLKTRDIVEVRRTGWSEVKKSIERVGLRDAGLSAAFILFILIAYFMGVLRGGPIWIPFVFGLVAAHALVRIARRRDVWREARRTAAGACHRCGYSLNGLPDKVLVWDSQIIRLGPGTCPECSLVWPGLPPEPPPPLKAGDRNPSY